VLKTKLKREIFEGKTSSQGWKVSKDLSTHKVISDFWVHAARNNGFCSSPFLTEWWGNSGSWRTFASRFNIMNDNDLVQVEDLVFCISTPREVVVDPICEGQRHLRSYDMVLK